MSKKSTTFAAEEGATYKLNIGCGRNIKEGWLNVDIMPEDGVDIVHDLEQCAKKKLPLPDDCVDEILMSHVIEHVQNVLPLMEELHRVAKPDAICMVHTPHGASDSAWGDPTHVRAMFPETFGFFTQPFYWRADYGYRGDWFIEKVGLRVQNTMPGEDPNAIMQRVFTQRNVAGEMIATLRAQKPIREPNKELMEKMHYELILDNPASS